MLISRVPEEGAGEGRGVPREDNSHEYQTASELFEIIAKTHTLNPSDDSLSNSDLVILYKNIELGTRLMPDTTADQKSNPRCNQRVETVVHLGADGDSESEADDAPSSHDLAPADLFVINKERLDLLNNPPSLENTLCHKFGDLEIKMSNLGTDILFKTATVKEQLDNLKLMSSSNDLDNSVLPSSLLDYICCKRLEDNYNFYMENIIRYVKHTIDQLKRISNGDYLTDKAREKWREIAEETANAESNKKILAASTSIPLHVERKRTGRTTTWDDIVHSEMDIRYLSKILEKKIFLEVPKIICGSYRLFSKQCADNLIISCEKKTRKKLDRKDSRVDVVLKLKRSESGHVISKINSIMILQAPPTLTNGTIIALPVPENEERKSTEQKIVELSNEIDEEIDSRNDVEAVREHQEVLSHHTSNNPFTYSSQHSQEEDGTSSPLSDACESSEPVRDPFKLKSGNCNHYQEASFVTLPDELSLSMQRLDIQSSLPEESIEDDYQEYQMTKKRSATRVRIKSPYENKSHIIDEKKRKKLLEIRERREKKKMALSESCKIMKHRTGKGTLTPQASSSVTKLSITNKSFYNSIYGQAVALESKQKSKVRKIRKESDADTSLEQGHEEAEVSLQTPVDKKKYVNKNYYLDEAETEMMLYMQAKGEDGISPSTSSAQDSAELAANLSLLTQHLSPSVADFGEKEAFAPASSQHIALPEAEDGSEKPHLPCPFEEIVMDHLVGKKSDHDVVPYNSPNLHSSEEKSDDAVVSTVECRKSIEKLYGLLKKIRKSESEERSSKLFSSLQSYAADITTFRESSTVQGSDSGTSLKHHMTSSETSNFSFNKPNITHASTMYETTPQTTNRATEPAPSVVPKVIISTKCQTVKTEPEKPKKDHKKVAFSAPKVIPDNPLKAISQLLHEFDNAQKNRHKSAEERPVKPKKEVAGERPARQSPAKGRSRLDQHLKVVDPQKNMVITVPRDRKQPASTDSRPPPNHESREKYDKFAKKKMSEIIDEVKEARGEAVRGPSKNSRLNTLAQPKKSYVQAHSEEYQTKYGRTLMADRLQRLAAAPAAGPRRPRRADPAPQTPAPASAPPPAPAKQPAPTPIESGARARRSASSSPASRRGPPAADKRSADKRAPDALAKHALPEAPPTLKEKMVAVECYVKSHYGRAVSSHSSEQRVARKSRVPLLPSDIDLASMTSSPPNEESTAIGSELHNLIDSMMKNAPMMKNGPALSALSEGLEDKSKTTDLASIEESSCKTEDRLMHFDSDVSDIFKDNIQTAVQEYKEKTDSISVESPKAKHDVRQFNSSSELQRLENALYSQMSIGNFQKRLRIKNLTITPKQSMQLIVGVQSGDVGSVMVKTSISQDFELTNCSLTSKISKLQKTMPILTDSSRNWPRSSMPLQVSTVGYAFPKYHNFNADPKMKKVMTSLMHANECERRTKTDDNEYTKPNKTNSTRDYTCQTFKGHLSSSYSRSNETKDMSCGNENPVNEVFENEASFTETQFSSREKDVIWGEDKNNNILSFENKVANVEKASQDDIEYTTSLDMLVGLLNEIQKITQTQVLNLTNDNSQLETFLNNAATLENNAKDSNGIVTITALDTSRMLDSSPSSYSFYITKSDDRLKEQQLANNEPGDDDISRIEKPTYVDKEVNAEVPAKEYTNMSTDVPSSFFPVTLNTSTSVSKSLILSDPSTQSMFSCRDSLYSGTRNKILELTTEADEFFEVTPDKIDEVITKIDEVAKLNIETRAPVIEEVERIEVRKKSKQVRKMRSLKCREDPLLRMKRDILVTVYSVLVLTVFAALSFPEVMYRA